MFSSTDMSFVNDFLERVAEKIDIMMLQIGAHFPTTHLATGVWDPKGENEDVSLWTTGFWPGMMWLMYIKSGKKIYREIAQECENKLDKAFDVFEHLNHDVGFMWGPTSVASYKLTGNERSKIRALHAATILAGRFNHRAGFIRAWNGDASGRAIIDCMMNIPLLWWASKETRDPRFANIAEDHAETVIRHFIRADGSVNHIVDFDPVTGELVATPGGQGYSEGSSWSRGQAWALYGFALAYLNTGKQEYLDIAKKVAHYFISNITPGKLPLVDFRAPDEPVYYDASAAAIATCGLIEIAKTVPEFEASIYKGAIIELFKALDADCNYGENDLVLLENSSGAYHRENTIHKPWIFGDYYLLEALMKIYGNDGNFSVHM